MKKMLLSLALVALAVALTLSAIFNISVCMWGCPQTLEVYSMQASIVVLVGLIGWVGCKYSGSTLRVRGRLPIHCKGPLRVGC